MDMCLKAQTLTRLPRRSGFSEASSFIYVSLKVLIHISSCALYYLPFRAMAGGKSVSENYAFAGMHHIFDQHTDAGELS